MTQQVLHIDLISLKPATNAADQETLIHEAGILLSIEDVIGGGVIQAGAESHFDLAVFFALKDFAALEPFGTHPGYSRFLQGKVAPLLQAFAGADVAMDAPLGSISGFGACVALSAPDEAYDWEIREKLEQWRDGVAGTAAVLGLAVGDRQNYRGLAMSFASTAFEPPQIVGERFDTVEIKGRSRPLA